jgi:hypothetical protein
MKYSASQAARATGKSIPTITRAYKSGKISGEYVEGIGYQFDPAEVHRVFPALTTGGNDTHTKMIDAPNETVALEVEVKMLREMLDQERNHASDLRKRLDEATASERRLTLMLTDHRPPPQAPRARGWWPLRRKDG